MPGSSWGRGGHGLGDPRGVTGTAPTLGPSPPSPELPASRALITPGELNHARPRRSTGDQRPKTLPAALADPPPGTFELQDS